MWQRTLLIFTSDNGGPIGTTLNTPLKGGKYSSLEGGVRVVTALGGGYLPQPLRGTSSPAFMHISDWVRAHL